MDVFDKTLQTTNIWLDEIMTALGPDRQAAWHALGAAPRCLRERLPRDLAVHLGAQLPLLVRGLYDDQWHAPAGPDRIRSQEDFLGRVSDALQGGMRPVNVTDAVKTVFGVLERPVTAGQMETVKAALPKDIAALWPQSRQQPRRSA